MAIARRRLSHKERKALYAKYLETDHWRQRRKAALANAGYRCQDCGRHADEAGPLEVHHLTYARIFAELDKDLRVLCRDCHGRRHGYLGEEDMIDLNTRKTGGRLVHLIDEVMLQGQEKSDAARLAARTPRIPAWRKLPAQAAIRVFQDAKGQAFQRQGPADIPSRPRRGRLDGGLDQGCRL